MTLEGINPDHDFFQVSKLHEDQKKKPSPKLEHFFPQIQVKTKKKVFTKNAILFFPEFKWIPTVKCTPASNYRGDADVHHTQTIGEDTVKLLGGYIPPIPPGFRHPWFEGIVTPDLKTRALKDTSPKNPSLIGHES